MSILFVLIPLTLILVAFGLWAFFWAVGNGQFDDLETPAWEVLVDDEPRDRDAEIVAKRE
ncbi:MAG: cbb3-type cytochrome oxidase assembly protein CcoS [Gammaproteobacteria bacterium]|nr:cbb3-type cytochrome oxidase assembly protein CcoS [Gammaproteobacteria bacterium]